MNTIDLTKVSQYVNENIVDFHVRRAKTLEEMNLDKLLKKNPYLFKAKNYTNGPLLVTDLLEAFLSSSEEKLFGDFLEDLAIYVAETTCNGHKSTAPGVDLEFFNNNTHYVVSIKSGTSWGNSSQISKLETDLKNAVARVKQSRRGINVQAVLGICNGKTRTGYLRGYLKVVGQNFWYLISENKNLYIEIVEPIGFKAKEHNDKFFKEKGNVINKLSKEFLNDYCDNSGVINWPKIVEHNSKNFDLNKFV